MKNRWPFISALLALCLLALAVGPGQAQGPGPQGDAGVQAALGTAFTYQGQLKQGGNPVNAHCDFQFSLWNAESDGMQVGATQTKTNVEVNDGLFTVQLDFGSSAFTGDARWLAVAVRCPAGSGSYTNLSPRQALTAAPYALSLRPGAVVSGGSTTLILSGGNVGLDAGGIFYGVRGWSASPSGWGVYGLSSSSNGRGMVGVAGASSGPTHGVYGQSDSTEGYGVYGYATAASGTTYGVYGESISPGGVGVYGRNTSSGSGVTGSSSTGDGVRGQSSGANKSGVYGVNTHSDGFGVYGRNTGSGTGVTGASSTGNGVRGESSGADKSGVFGVSAHPDGYGVYGRNTARGSGGYLGGIYGVHGYVPTLSEYAGFFEGKVWVRGDLSVGGAKLLSYSE